MEETARILCFSESFKTVIDTNIIPIKEKETGTEGLVRGRTVGWYILDRRDSYINSVGSSAGHELNWITFCIALKVEPSL